MKVWIDRDTCDSNLSACLSCFGELMARGKVDRGCVLEWEDDGAEDVTLYMRSDGADHGPYVVPADQRELVAYEGWDKFVDFVPNFRRNEGIDQLKDKE
jgi:hypothetical protein